jgi:hypothetical protein
MEFINEQRGLKIEI